MQLGPLTFPECFDFEFPLLARLKKEYSHTPLWFEAAFRGETQYYGCDAESFCWSLECLFWGIMPSQRHDGLPWGTDDPPQRKKWSGKPLQLQAMLTQFRGACFVLKFFFQFSGACLLVPKPFCRRLEDAQGRFSFASAQ